MTRKSVGNFKFHTGIESLSQIATRDDRVCVLNILGGESSGKSTLARALAGALGTCQVPEYGRELWVQQGGRLDFDDLLRIAEVQIEREERLRTQAVCWLVCDTSPLTTLGYSHWMFGRADPRVVALAARPYERVLLCAGDFDFVQDGTRQGEAFRRRQNRWYEQELDRRGWAFTCLSGSLLQRVEQVLRHLSG